MRNDGGSPATSAGGLDVVDAPPIDTDHGDATTVARLSVMASVIVAVIVIITNVVNARVYGATTLGLFALSSSPWLLTLAISNFGENAALIRLLSVEPVRSPRTLPIAAASLAISTVWTTVITAVIFAIAAVGLSTVDTDANLVLSAGALSLTFLLVVNPTWILQSAFVAFGRAGDIFVSRLVQPFLFLVLSIGFARIEASVTMLVLAAVLSSVAGLLYVAVRSLRLLGGSLGRRQFAEARSSVRSLLSFAWRWAPGNLANALTSQAGLWAVASLGGTAQAGVYSRVLGLQERAGDLSARLQDGVMPSLVRHESDGNVDEFAKAWWLILGPALSAAVISIPPAMMSSTPAMSILGEEFISGGPALMWVCLSVGFMLLLAGLNSPFIALNRPGTSSIISIGRAVVILPILIPLTSRYGAAGAAGSFAVVIGLECTVRLVIVADRLQLHRHLIEERQLHSAVLGGMASSAVTLIFRAVLADTTLYDLTAGAVGVAVGGLVWLARRRRTAGRHQAAPSVAGG